VRDNAGNVQSVVQSGPRFFISGVAQSFRIDVASNPMTAGTVQNFTVTAVDGPSGTGNITQSYAGTVDFYVDGDQNGSGPEVTGGADVTHGLPSQYTFTTGVGGDQGQHSFSLVMRKAGARTLRVQQSDNASLAGTTAVTVHRNIATRLQLIADCNVSGQLPAAGVITSGSEGRSGTPRQYTAGQQVVYCAQVVDDYWNLYVDSTVTVSITDSDSNNDSLGDGGTLSLVVPGSTTFQRTFVTADPAGQTVQATGAGALPNSSNPSTPVVVVGAPGQQLLAVLPGETAVPGKFAVAPFGKSGTPSDVQAGSTYTIRVYSVDQYYNPDLTLGWPISARLYTDAYTTTPSIQPLNAGTTTFVFTPLVAGSQNFQFKTSALTGPASNYYTPNPTRVWWAPPTKLQMVAQGQTAAPGLAPFDSNPTTGGRSVSAPATLTAGVTTTFTINLVDQYFNVVSGTTPFMPLTSSVTMPLVGSDPPKVLKQATESARRPAMLSVRTRASSWASIVFCPTVPVLSRLTRK
jgi:hypothetical protein